MKGIFTKNKNVKITAFLNWRIENSEPILNMQSMADGFLTSALELANDSITDNLYKKADIIIFPILTNANHGIELYLKSLIWTLNILMDTDKKIEGSHNIKQILQTVQSRIRDYKDPAYLKEFNVKNQDLIEYVSELFELIGKDTSKDKMDFSRYPISKKYENHFYVEEVGNVEIDLPNFVDRFTRIKNSLQEYAEYFYYQELKQDS
jgi:hypothetical protein